MRCSRGQMAASRLPPERSNASGGQITLRNSRRLEAAMRSSRLPYVRTLGNFDFSFQPSEP